MELISVHSHEVSDPHLHPSTSEESPPTSIKTPPLTSQPTLAASHILVLKPLLACSASKSYQRCTTSPNCHYHPHRLSQ